MSWDGWIEVWDRHSRSDRFRRKLDIAVDVATKGNARGRLFLALSGGKDGVAVAAVLKHAGIVAPAAHCHTDLNTPGMLEASEETARILGIDLDIVEPDIDGTVWDLLASLPRQQSVLHGPLFDSLLSRIASGNMLVAYQYRGQFDGSFNGLRAEESRGRRWNRRIRGPLYQQSADRAWMCSPIVDWSARDVYAAAQLYKLPICQHYRLMLERFEVDPESPASRVDCLLVADGIGALGGYAHAKALYPEIWRRLVLVRPELAKEA